MPKGGEVDLGPAAGGSRGWPRPQESAEQCSGGQREASYGEKVKKIVVHQQSGQAGVWTKSSDYWTVYHDMIENVKTAFDKNGIEIPYSKLDVNIKNNA